MVDLGNRCNRDSVILFYKGRLCFFFFNPANNFLFCIRLFLTTIGIPGFTLFIAPLGKTGVLRLMGIVLSLFLKLQLLSSFFQVSIVLVRDHPLLRRRI